MFLPMKQSENEDSEHFRHLQKLARGPGESNPPSPLFSVNCSHIKHFVFYESVCKRHDGHIVFCLNSFGLHNDFEIHPSSFIPFYC